MELAKTLLKLWSLRVWIAVGAVIALLASVASLTLLPSKVYATASTQLVVDAPRSALGDAQKDLTPYTARAFVFARLMTTPQALQYIGQAAGVPGNLISASGPTELTGTQATHAPTAVQGTQLTSAPARYTLNFLQNPQLPTVDVYAKAPDTKRAMALANGAVSGFAAYITYLDNQSGVPAGQRIDIRQLGSATGGVVDPGASKALAFLIFVFVLALWCGLVLFATNLRAHMRLAREERRAPDAAAASTGVDFMPAARQVDFPPAMREFEERPDDDVHDRGRPDAPPSNGTEDPDENRRRAWVPLGS